MHFADNNHPDKKDAIWKIRSFFKMILEPFSKFFYPFQKVVIDESLILFKGRLVFKQYIPSKRHRFGLKIFVLCDCETGIVLDMIMYTGTDVDIPNVGRTDPLGKSGAIVKKMMTAYLGKRTRCTKVTGIQAQHYCNSYTKMLLEHLVLQS